MTTENPNMSETITALQAENARLRELLKDHHDWHLQAGPIGLQDGKGGWIEIDNGAEYSDSTMCERTTAALAGMPPDKAPVMPRGGISAYWWQVGILERRKRKTLEAAARAENARLRAALEPFAAIADLVRHTDVRDGEIVYRLPNPAGGYWVLERKHFVAAQASLQPEPQ